MELVQGTIVVPSLLDYETAEVATEIIIQLGNWVRPRKLGRVTGSRAGSRLSNSDIRVPWGAFVHVERLRRSPRTFAELTPDLTIEVKSLSDIVSSLRKKIDDFLSFGT